MKINNNVKLLGEITAKFYDQSGLSEVEKTINRFIIKNRNRIPFIMKLYRLGELAGTDIHKNVICNPGFGAIAKILVGDSTYTGNGEINKAALGTGAGTPGASDTGLFTESYRNNIASGSASANVAYLTAFYTEAECNGTYTEFGNFIDGLAGAGTGLLWSHIAGLNWVKDTNTVIVVSCKYTLTSV